MAPLCYAMLHNLPSSNLDPRVDPNQMDDQGRSPLMIAAGDGDIEKVKILLRCPKVRPVSK